MRDQGLAFFGKIAAGQAHEVTNVLNVINELAGLQQDILSGSGQGDSSESEKLMGIAERIQAQVERGETIVRNINLFAHSTDAPVAVFDLRETLGRILFLAERSTRLQKTDLISDLPEETLALEANPFSLQQAVFLCIEIGLQAAAKERKITVGYTLVDGGVEIAVTSADRVAQVPDVAVRLSLLGTLMEEVGGEVKATPAGDGPSRLVLFIPKNRQHDSGGGSAGRTEGPHGSGEGTPGR